MPAQLFHSPKAGTSFTGGSKLYFYETGTTTDLAVYQDDGLTTPHAQPVVADSNGVFAPIYLDTETGDIKVVLDNSSDVEQWTVDGYPIEDTTSIAADVATNTSDISDIGGRLSTAEGEIDTLQTESADYESRITTLEGSSNVTTSDFSASLGSSGYRDTPDGLREQWGTVSVGGNGSASVSFPVDFGEVYSVQITGIYDATGSGRESSSVNAVTATGMDVFNADGAATEFYWRALGTQAS